MKNLKMLIKIPMKTKNKKVLLYFASTVILLILLTLYQNQLKNAKLAHFSALKQLKEANLQLNKLYYDRVFKTKDIALKRIKEIVDQENAKKVMAVIEVSAYNVGDINQCSGDPCISANGENICLAINIGYKRCAANFVSFGTKLEIEGYGICVVTDRMNSRYKNRVDIAMSFKDLEKAKEFGVKNLKVSIIQ